MISYIIRADMCSAAGSAPAQGWGTLRAGTLRCAAQEDTWFCPGLSGIGVLPYTADHAHLLPTRSQGLRILVPPEQACKPQHCPGWRKEILPRDAAAADTLWAVLVLLRLPGVRDAHWPPFPARSPQAAPRREPWSPVVPGNHKVLIGKVGGGVEMAEIRVTDSSKHAWVRGRGEAGLRASTSTSESRVLPTPALLLRQDPNPCPSPPWLSPLLPFCQDPQGPLNAFPSQRTGSVPRPQAAPSPLPRPLAIPASTR